jgi:DNA repair ATPase RecN
MEWIKKILGIKNLEEKVEAYDTILKQILVEIADINKKISLIGDKVILVPTEINELKERINKVENRIKRYISRKLKQK